MNIKYDTLKTWKSSKWWVEMSEDIRTEGHIALSHKMQQVATKAIEVTMDRLENGDHVLSPTGGILRKPVAMRDAHQVAISFQDRALKLETGNQTEHNPAVVDRLQSIADAFAKMIKPPKQLDVIDVEYKESEESITNGEHPVTEHIQDISVVWWVSLYYYYNQWPTVCGNQADEHIRSRTKHPNT